MKAPHIDISLTSISTRMDSLPATLRSLLEQNYPEFAVHLYLSKEAYLLDQGVPEIPKEIAKMAAASEGKLTITYCENSGPYRKLIPYLYQNWGLSKLVVTVDDDTIYPAGWLEQMVESYSKFGCVIGYRGHGIRFRNGALAPYRSWMRSKIEDNPSRLLLPTGKDGILYNTAFFPIGVLNLRDAVAVAPTTDDLWFRWHLAMNKINTHLINIDYTTNSFEENDYDSSLYLNFNVGGGNDAAVARLDTYFKDRFGFDIATLSPHIAATVSG